MRMRFEDIQGYTDSAWKNFESLCSLLVLREIPTAKAIEGKGGDEGLDILVGNIGDADRIFQAKYFYQTLTRIQKRQIEKSIEVAVQKHNPKHWTLCIAKDFTPSEERWFEELRNKNSSVIMDYWNATALIEKLLGNLDIRHQFFPVLDDLGGFDLLPDAFFAQQKDKTNQETYFYDGARPIWSDIVFNRDIRRDVTDELMRNIEGEKNGLFVHRFIAPGGSGKSTFLLRVGYELVTNRCLVLYHQRDKNVLNAKAILDFHENSSRERAFLLIDDVARVSNFEGFFTYLVELNPNITILLASRSFEYVAVDPHNSRRNNLPSERSYVLDRLTDNEITSLINKLANLGKIRQPESEITELVEYYGTRSNRSILPLVFLLTRKNNFDNIITDELKRLRNTSLVLYNAYRYVCLLHTMDAYATRVLLSNLVDDKNIIYELSSLLVGLIEEFGEQIRARHDLIAEQTVRIMFEMDNIGSINMMRRLVTMAVEKEEWSIVEKMTVYDNFPAENRGDFVIPLFEAKAHLNDPKPALEWLSMVGFESKQYGGAKALSILLERQFLKIIELSLRPRYEITFSTESNDEQHTLKVVFKPQQSETSASDEVLYELIEECSSIFQNAITPHNHADALGQMFFEIICQILPNAPRIYYIFGEYLMELHNDLLAVDILQKAVDLDPSYLGAYVLLCCAAYMADMPQLASENFDKAFSLDPEAIVNVTENYYVEIMLEFLALSGRVEDWLFLFAHNQKQLDDLLHGLHNDLKLFKKWDLAITVEDDRLYKDLRKQEGRTENTGRPLDFEGLIQTSVWLREQPLSVKREFAKDIWKRIAHSLPGDGFKLQ